MNEEKDSSLTKIRTFFTGVTGVMTAIVACATAILAGYWVLEDKVTERNAERISEATIVKITEQINPISRTDVLEFRRRDSIERIHAEQLAINYMNRTDSLMLVLTSETKARRALAGQLARIEAKIDANKIADPNDRLARIWEFLKQKEKSDSTSQQLDQMMQQIRKMNAEKMKQIRSGDRPQ